jgi:hypothetical protein
MLADCLADNSKFGPMRRRSPPNDVSAVAVQMSCADGRGVLGYVVTAQDHPQMAAAKDQHVVE